MSRWISNSKRRIQKATERNVSKHQNNFSEFLPSSHHFSSSSGGSCSNHINNHRRNTIEVTIRHHAAAPVLNNEEEDALNQKHSIMFDPMNHDSYDQTNNNNTNSIFSKHEHVIHLKERTLGPPSVKNGISWRNPSKLHFNSNHHQDKENKKRTCKEKHSEAFQNAHERYSSKMNEGDEKVYQYKRFKCGQSVSRRRRRMQSDDT